MLKSNIGRHYESYVSACGVNKVADYLVRRRLVAAALTVLEASCGMGQSGSSASRPFTPDIQGISDAIATGAHYPTSAIELTSSEVRLRIEVSDVKLAMSDEATRNNAAGVLVGVAEQVLAT